MQRTKEKESDRKKESTESSQHNSRRRQKEHLLLRSTHQEQQTDRLKVKRNRKEEEGSVKPKQKSGTFRLDEEKCRRAPCLARLENWTKTRNRGYEREREREMGQNMGGRTDAFLKMGPKAVMFPLQKAIRINSNRSYRVYECFSDVINYLYKVRFVFVFAHPEDWKKGKAGKRKEEKRASSLPLPLPSLFVRCSIFDRTVRMWNFASHAIAGNSGLRRNLLKPAHANLDFSDEDASPCASREEGLECPVCWESFNIVENVPYVLWCGHTLCKNCVLGLQWAVVKYRTVTVQLPLFISCPWCQFLSFRLVYKGQLKLPRKNFFLLWMVESMNSCHTKWYPADSQSVSVSNQCLLLERGDYCHHQNIRTPRRNLHSDNSDSNVEDRSAILNVGIVGSCMQESLAFVANITAKLPLVAIFLFYIFYALPASVAILVLYILVTILFALPSFLLLYFAYPSLEWLVREITS
ncbi:hypothetical protein Cni_G08368 [Canna indica]|uniref:RING-type domain-containing protein n=1 Tax=Canna indica TaxID=4628 RepID=A0AAQ3K425_9LILI|nr:hypothetical protein Cni_G08368 [Canna indica]